MHANLSKANLEGAKLIHANLRGAYLRHANLHGAHLNHADLEGAHLGGANFQFAQMQGAKVRNSYRSGTNFAAANLDGADISGAELNREAMPDTEIAEVPQASIWATQSVPSSRHRDHLRYDVSAKKQVFISAEQSEQEWKALRGKFWWFLAFVVFMVVAANTA